ncbi:hypothetical protein C8R46DRAFT_1208977 [Mycena filopes]|nr:hypothetical protein C8R46DRAFT_1208977 [Mycena filopes]
MLSCPRCDVSSSSTLPAIFAVITAVFISLWIIPDSFSGLAAGAFCIQFGVQGALGVLKDVLELTGDIVLSLTDVACALTSPLPSPPSLAFMKSSRTATLTARLSRSPSTSSRWPRPRSALRATFPVVAYQLGNTVSSASAQIEATGGDHLKTTIRGVVVPDYAKVQGILIGCVAAFVLVITIIGPENHGSHFEKHRAAFDQGGSADDAWIDDEGVHHADWARGAGSRY